MKNKLTKNQKEEIIKDYNAGFTNKQLRDKYLVSVQTIYNILLSANVKKKFGRFYDFNQQYFDNIDTPDKAYFLGWLYSDGNNYPLSGHIQLKLQHEDKAILETFSHYVSGGLCNIRNVKRKESKDQVCLKLSSMYMSKKLEEKGVIQAKTFKLEFPSVNILPEHLQRHFIRGYFDGDGCITSYQSKKGLKPDYSFILSGRDVFLKTCQEIIIKNCGVKLNKLIKNKSIHNLIYGGNIQTKRILDWLYKDCDDLFLIRKKEKYHNLCKQLSLAGYNKLQQ